MSVKRELDGFKTSLERQRRKWDKIVSSFITGDLAMLRAVQRSGARGRILDTLVRQCFDVLGIGYESEPVFVHVSPDSWYVEFAARHELTLRTHDYYNPDILLGDGSSAEITPSRA